MDEVGTNYVTGISLLTADIKENKSMDEITNHIELLVFDLTNSFGQKRPFHFVLVIYCC